MIWDESHRVLAGERRAHLTAEGWLLAIAIGCVMGLVGGVVKALMVVLP